MINVRMSACGAVIWRRGCGEGTESGSSEETRYFFLRFHNIECCFHRNVIHIGLLAASSALGGSLGLGYIPSGLYTQHRVRGKVGQLGSYGEGMRDGGGGSSQDSFQGTRRPARVSGAAV